MDDNKRNYIIIGVLIFLITIFMFYFLITKTSFATNSIFSDLDGKKSFVIYYTNSNTNKCSNCNKIKEKLDSLEVKYKIYDVGRETRSETEELLKKLKIDFDVLYPALIVVDKGEMFANLLDINEDTDLEAFFSSNGVGDDGTIS